MRTVKPCKCASFFSREPAICRLATYPEPALCGQACKAPLESKPPEAKDVYDYHYGWHMDQDDG